MIIWFDEAPGADLVGGKGAALAALAGAGLPVPPGFCIPHGADVSERDVTDALARLGAEAVAVRSSAIGEDGAGASFAGVHLSKLNVRTPAGVIAAFEDVRASALTPAARAYRASRGIEGEPMMAAVVQQMVLPDVAGIAFTRDPVTNEDRIVIEATWGLGESIVSGAVTPDRFVVARDGRVLSTNIGDKDIAVIAAGDGTIEVPVDPERRRARCIDDGTLAAVVALAQRCEEFFGCPQDVEWALVAGTVWLLQSRPITT